MQTAVESNGAFRFALPINSGATLELRRQFEPGAQRAAAFWSRDRDVDDDVAEYYWYIGNALTTTPSLSIVGMDKAQTLSTLVAVSSFSQGGGSTAVPVFLSLCEFPLSNAFVKMSLNSASCRLTLKPTDVEVMAFLSTVCWLAGLTSRRRCAQNNAVTYADLPALSFTTTYTVLQKTSNVCTLFVCCLFV